MRKMSVMILVFLLIFSAVFSCYPCVRDTEIVMGIKNGLSFALSDGNEGEDTTYTAENITVPSESEAAEDTTEDNTSAAETTAPETTSPETTAPETTVPETTVPVVTAPPETTPSPVTEPATNYVPPAPVPPTEFDNSLFIGDSRTMGLLYYGGIGNADVFATKGMTVFRAFTETISVRSIGETKLQDLIESRSYERVYIMLGINEIGSSLEGISAKYTALVNAVKAAQPDAVIYLCANLHITHSRSVRDNTYNNTRLNAINDFVATLADGVQTKYIDVNVIFDDSNGGFGAAYTTDDFHPMPRYYKQWVEWLSNET